MKEYIVFFSHCPPVQQYVISLQINQIIDGNNKNHPASSVLDGFLITTVHFHCDTDYIFSFIHPTIVFFNYVQEKEKTIRILSGKSYHWGIYRETWKRHLATG